MNPEWQVDMEAKAEDVSSAKQSAVEAIRDLEYAEKRAREADAGLEGAQGRMMRGEDELKRCKRVDREAEESVRRSEVEVCALERSRFGV
jgi:hypothetical protein